MARKARIHVDGAVYCVTLRIAPGLGPAQSPSIQSGWHALLQEGAQRFGFRVLAFCWLEDSLHMVVEVGRTPLSKIMQNLAFRLTRLVETAQEGSPVERTIRGRYGALIVDADKHLGDVVAHVHNLPIWEGLCTHPLEYDACSHRDYVDKIRFPFLDTAVLLHREPWLGDTEKLASWIESRRNDIELRRMCQRPLDGRAIGDQDFLNRMLTASRGGAQNRTPLSQVIEVVCDEFSLAVEALDDSSRSRALNEVRQMIAWLATEYQVASLTEVAERFHRDLSTMSRNQRHFRDRLEQEPALKDKLLVCRGKLG